MEDEGQEIAFVGALIFQNLCEMIFLCGVNGGYILAFAIGMRILLQKENYSRARKALIGLLLAGFVFTLLYICEVIIGSLVILKFGLVVSLPGGLAAQEMAANSQSALMSSLVLQSLCGDVMYLIADAVIVWRAWAIWVEKSNIKCSLFILLLLDIGVTIADIITDAEFDTNPNTRPIPTETLDWVGIVLSLTVNIVATLLIAYRAWAHHRSIQTFAPNRKTQVEMILFLVVESGAIFGVVQIFSIVFQALDVHATPLSPIDTASTFVQGLYAYSAAINPVALIILVQTGSTYDHSFHLEEGEEIKLPTVQQQCSQEDIPSHIAN